MIKVASEYSLSALLALGSGIYSSPLFRLINCSILSENQVLSTSYDLHIIL